MPRKREQAIQLALCNHIRHEYPDVIFYSDFAAGLKLPIWLAKIRKDMTKGRGMPDLMIDKKMAGFGGLRIELKAEGVTIYNKNGTVRSSSNNLFQIQHNMLEGLRKEGYCAEFAIGYEQAKGLVDWYMAGADPKTLLFERSTEGNQRFTNTKTGSIF